MLTSATTKMAVAILLAMSVQTFQVDAGAFKCYEDYRAITDTSSPQYALQMEAYTDECGLRKIDGRYCVALGSAFGTDIGTKYDIVLASGYVLPVILADQKADRDTINGHTQDKSGAVVEFIVEADRLPAEVRHMGDVSYIGPEFTGEVKEIRRLEK